MRKLWTLLALAASTLLVPTPASACNGFGFAYSAYTPQAVFAVPQPIVTGLTYQQQVTTVAPAVGYGQAAVTTVAPPTVGVTQAFVSPTYSLPTVFASAPYFSSFGGYGGYGVGFRPVIGVTTPFFHNGFGRTVVVNNGLFGNRAVVVNNGFNRAVVVNNGFLGNRVVVANNRTVVAVNRGVIGPRRTVVRTGPFRTVVRTR